MSLVSTRPVVSFINRSTAKSANVLLILLAIVKRSNIIHGEWITLNEYINAERSNKFHAANLKKQEMERMMWQMKGLLPIEGKIDIEFQAYTKHKRQDPDNLYVYFCKSYLDSLVKLKVIPNDGQKNIGSILFREVKTGEPRMEILYG